MSSTTGRFSSSTTNAGWAALARSVNSSMAASEAKPPSGTSTSPGTPSASRLVAIKRSSAAAPTSSLAERRGRADHMFAVVQNDYQ